MRVADHREAQQGCYKQLRNFKCEETEQTSKAEILFIQIL